MTTFSNYSIFLEIFYKKLLVLLIQQNSKEMKKIIINLIETIPRTKFTMFVLKTIRNRFKFIIDLVDPNNIRRKKTKSLLVPNYLKTTCDDAKMIVNVNDHIGYKTYLNNTFDNSLLLLSKFLQIDKNDIIIDVGANIGTTGTIWLAGLLVSDGMPKGDTLRIAMAHTGVNLFMAFSLLPFVKPIANFLSRF